MGSLVLTKVPKKENNLRRCSKLKAACMHRVAAVLCWLVLRQARSVKWFLFFFFIFCLCLSLKILFPKVVDWEAMHLFLACLWGNSSVYAWGSQYPHGWCRQSWHHRHIQTKRSATQSWRDLFAKLGLGSTAAKSLWLALGEYQLAADEGSHLAN